jgi:hypothetical protein
LNNRRVFLKGLRAARRGTDKASHIIHVWWLHYLVASIGISVLGNMTWCAQCPCTMITQTGRYNPDMNIVDCLELELTRRAAGPGLRNLAHS